MHGKLRLRDKFSLFSRYVAVIMQAIIIGTCFLQLPQTLNGLIPRGGAIFSSPLAHLRLSLGDIPDVFSGRLIMQKHRSYSLYSAVAYHLAKVAHFLVENS